MPLLAAARMPALTAADVVGATAVPLAARSITNVPTATSGEPAPKDTTSHSHACVAFTSLSAATHFSPTLPPPPCPFAVSSDQPHADRAPQVRQASQGTRRPHRRRRHRHRRRRRRPLLPPLPLRAPRRPPRRVDNGRRGAPDVQDAALPRPRQGRSAARIRTRCRPSGPLPALLRDRLVAHALRRRCAATRRGDVPRRAPGVPRGGAPRSAGAARARGEGRQCGEDEGADPGARGAAAECVGARARVGGGGRDGCSSRWPSSSRGDADPGYRYSSSTGGAAGRCWTGLITCAFGLSVCVPSSYPTCVHSYPPDRVWILPYPPPPRTPTSANRRGHTYIPYIHTRIRDFHGLYHTLFLLSLLCRFRALRCLDGRVSRRPVNFLRTGSAGGGCRGGGISANVLIL
ncbi:hypothetical protein B0H17DRAFT_1114876 [Mycena rosella]|uniref:Uncharacterized protein n=1 Tax=Mycena rosella TaxID=1033263 RepID=A0AAD7BC12_MYCRO|nr:hypothetical protein B0H17DRAFT_1114876 [Mycena rosella]